MPGKPSESTTTVIPSASGVAGEGTTTAPVGRSIPVVSRSPSTFVLRVRIADG
ncbi:MAG: hypothetical protein KatS3mg014_1927 [Actinomycetota bacterium]|nr:MAG: hypothetical protein KatS3mg014_1927 [Actinomycetota bacterium]